LLFAKVAVAAAAISMPDILSTFAQFAAEGINNTPIRNFARVGGPDIFDD
jgi:hypothetical protein